MKRYLTKLNQEMDGYKIAVREVLEKLKDLPEDSLILKTIEMTEIPQYKELLYKTIDNLKNNKRYITDYSRRGKESVYEILNDQGIEWLLDEVNDNPIKCTAFEDFSPFKAVQDEIVKLLKSENNKDDIIQGWQFLNLYNDEDRDIAVTLCTFDDELGYLNDMGEEEYEKWLEENHIDCFYDVMLYGFAIFDRKRGMRTFYLDLWNG